MIDQSVGKIYINGVIEDSEIFAFDDVYYEYEDVTHVIGQTYIGFIYSICIK